MSNEVGVLPRQILTDIADAIREKGNTSELMMPTQMAQNIRNISSGGSGVPVTDVQVSLTDTEGGFSLNQRSNAELAKIKIQSKYRAPMTDQILRHSGIGSVSNFVSVVPSLGEQGMSSDAIEVSHPVTPDRIVINSIVAPTERSYPDNFGLNEQFKYVRDSADRTYPGGPDIDALSFADIAIRVDTPDSLWMNYDGLLAFYSLDPESPYSIWEDTAETKDYIASLKENGYIDIKDTRAYAIRPETETYESEGSHMTYCVENEPDCQFQNELIFGETALYVEEVKLLDLRGGKIGDVISVPGLLSKTEDEETIYYFRPYFAPEKDSETVLNSEALKTYYQDYFTVDATNETITLLVNFNNSALWLYAVTPKTYKVALPPWCPSFSFKQVASLASRKISAFTNVNHHAEYVDELENDDIGNYAIQIFAEIALKNGLLDSHYIPVGFCSAKDYHNMYFSGSYENILHYSYAINDYDLGKDGNMANSKALNALEDMLLDSESRSMGYSGVVTTTGKYPYIEVNKTYGIALPVANVLKTTKDVYYQLQTNNATTQNGVTITSSTFYLILNGTSTADTTLNYGENIVLEPHHRYLFSNFSADSSSKIENDYVRCELTGNTSNLTISQYTFNSNYPNLVANLIVNNTDNEIVIGANAIIKSGKTLKRVVVAPRLLDLTVMYGENYENEATDLTSLIISASSLNYLETSYRQDNVVALHARDEYFSTYSNSSVINDSSAKLPIPLAIRKLPGYGASFMGERNYVDWNEGIYHQSVGVVKLNSKNNKANNAVALINSIPDSYCLVTPINNVNTSAVLVKINHGYTDGFNYDPNASYWVVEPPDTSDYGPEDEDEWYTLYNDEYVLDSDNDMYALMHNGARMYHQDPSLTSLKNYKPNACIMLPFDVDENANVYVIYKLATPIEIDISQYIKTNRLAINQNLFVETKQFHNDSQTLGWLSLYCGSKKLVDYTVKTPKSS